MNLRFVPFSYVMTASDLEEENQGLTAFHCSDQCGHCPRCQRERALVTWDRSPVREDLNNHRAGRR
jgi:hypothetical protein